MHIQDGIHHSIKSFIRAVAIEHVQYIIIITVSESLKSVLLFDNSSGHVGKLAMLLGRTQLDAWVADIAHSFLKCW